MSKDNTVTEQPGLGVRWPLDREGNPSPLIFPDGRVQRVGDLSAALDASGDMVGVVGPGGAVVPYYRAPIAPISILAAAGSPTVTRSNATTN